jgi:hypothetical protein
VTGVNANQVITPIVGNSTEAGLTLKTSILSSEAKSLVSGQLVKIENQIESEIRRSYRFAPTGSSITPANTVEINTFFRQTNSIKYVRVNSSTGRFIFQRFGMFAGQTEPLATDNTIEFQNEGNGLVRVISAQASGPGGSGKLSARVGDMMYIFRGTPFASDAWCHDPQIGSSGVSSSSTPEYIGYPVVHVVDENEILVIAPNIQTFNTTVLTSSTDLVFLPAIYNEKNIQTNHAAGAQLDKLINDGKMYYLVKTLGAGLVSVVIQNSSDEASDSAELETMSVATDDIAVFGEGFDPANQGSFKIIAHNGRNHLIVYNPGGGKDELIDQNVLENGGKGSRKWRVGPIQTEERPLRIVANESVKIGDLLRISTPGSTATTWFDAPFFGSFKVTNIGYHAFTYSGPLPHTPGTGSIDLTKLCPYVDVEMANAPQAVRDNLGAFVDDFIVGLNDKAIGFVEGTPFSCFRVVSGSGVDPQDIENNEIFLAPKYNSEKISDIFGSVLTAMHKIGFELQINQGIDGYKIYTGLVREAHRTIDGLPSSAIVFPGVKAAGAFIEVLNPLIRTISLSLRVYPKDGVSLNTISDLIKSTVSGYVNNLGVGRPVVLSEIIRIVQGLPGVFSVEILDTAPDAVDGRIVTASSEKAIIINTDEITVS